MAPLLTNKITALYNILALQEPWQNPFKNATYCPSSSAFYITYDNQARRSCFLINKSLNINTWDIDYSGPNICSIRLQLSDIVLQIYNFYNQPLGSYSTINYPSSLIYLSGLLAKEGEHLILGDFNLYYPFWSNYRNPAAHLAADVIVEALSAGNIKIVTLRGMTI